MSIPRGGRAFGLPTAVTTSHRSNSSNSMQVLIAAGRLKSLHVCPDRQTDRQVYSPPPRGRGMDDNASCPPKLKRKVKKIKMKKRGRVSSVDDEGRKGDERRLSFLKVCGCISVYNLHPQGHKLKKLVDTYCEIFSRFDGALLYRSGVVTNSTNPTWTLRSRDWNSEPKWIKREGLGESVQDKELKLKVYKIESTCCTGEGVFPYHHFEELDSKVEREVLLEQDFSLDKLKDTCLTTLEESSLPSFGMNQIVLGLYYNESKSSGVLRLFVPAEECKAERGVGKVNREEYQELKNLVQEVRAMCLAADEKEKLAEQAVESCASLAEDCVSKSKLRKEKKSLVLREKKLLRLCKEMEQAVQEEEKANEAEAARLLEAACWVKKGGNGRQVERLLDEAQRKFERELCVVRTHRQSLLNDLVNIYPLQERYGEDKTSLVYTIRGLQLPDSIFQQNAVLGSFEEEQISTALGYLAHFVDLLSKYLDVSLRFVPLPHSSSSTICDPLVISAETPHEPLSRYQKNHHNARPSIFPQYIFGSASGRLGRPHARHALSLGTFPLYWKGLGKSLRTRFERAVDLLSRDVSLISFVIALNATNRTHNRRKNKAHVIAELRKILADF